jgi:hypothetical protein
MKIFKNKIIFVYLLKFVILTSSVDIMATDFVDNASPPISSTVVADHVQKAKVANKFPYNYQVAQVEFTAALSLVKRAIARDASVDVTGNVGKGIFIDQVTYLPGGSFMRIPGSRTEEMYYDGSWSLAKRASQLAYYAGDCAEQQGNCLMAAELYAEAGNLSDGASPNFHKFSAMQYAILEDYPNIFMQIEKTTSLAAYKHDKDYDFVLSQLADICRTQAAKLRDVNPEMAGKFMEKVVLFS